MQTSHNLASTRRLSLSNSWYFLASALVALGAFTLLALQRGALGSLGTAPAWAWPSIATGTAVGAVALGWLALTRFAREAEAQPYVWTAPLLVIFCFAPLSQLGVQLPLPGVQLTPFLIGAGTLIVGGGAFGRVPSAGARTLGATLTLTPTLLLVLGYVLQSGAPRGALAHVDGPGLWLLGMTMFAGLGALVIAIVARSLEQVTAHGQAGLAAADAGRLAQLVEHAQAQWAACQHELLRLAEERQLFEAWLHDQRTQLAQQMRSASQAPLAPVARTAQEGVRIPDPTEPRVRRRITAVRPPSDDTAEFMAMARPGLGWPTKLVLVSLALGGLAAGGYLGWYKPQLVREQAAVRAAQEAAAVQAADVAVLREKIAAEQARSAQVLEEERTKADAARKQAEAMVVEAADQAAAATSAAAAEAAAAEVAAAKASARASTARRAKKRVAAKSGERRVARAAAEAAAEDDPIAGLDGI